MWVLCHLFTHSYTYQTLSSSWLASGNTQLLGLGETEYRPSQRCIPGTLGGELERTGVGWGRMISSGKCGVFVSLRCLFFLSLARFLSLWRSKFLTYFLCPLSEDLWTLLENQVTGYNFLWVLSENISTSSLKDNFEGYRVLGVLFLSALWIFCSTPFWHGFWRKVEYNIHPYPSMGKVSPPPRLSIFLVSLIFCSLNVTGLGVDFFGFYYTWFWASWICCLGSVISFQKFSTITSNIFSFPFIFLFLLSPLSICYTFCNCPPVLEYSVQLFFWSHSFSVLEISIDISYNAPMFPWPCLIYRVAH